MPHLHIVHVDRVATILQILLKVFILRDKSQIIYTTLTLAQTNSFGFVFIQNVRSRQMNSVCDALSDALMLLLLSVWTMTHQVLKDQRERLLRVDDVMEGHYVRVFQILQQRHWGRER